MKHTTKQLQRMHKRRKFKVGQTVLICFNTEEQKRAGERSLFQDTLMQELNNTSAVVTAILYNTYYGLNCIVIKAEIHRYEMITPTICLH